MTTCRYINSGQSNFKFEYLGEIKTEFENILGHESGGQVVLIHEKTRGQKSRATVPLNGQSSRILIEFFASTTWDRFDMSF
jgi:hypothetical protein